LVRPNHVLLCQVLLSDGQLLVTSMTRAGPLDRARDITPSPPHCECVRMFLLSLRSFCDSRLHGWSPRSISRCACTSSFDGDGYHLRLTRQTKSPLSSPGGNITWVMLWVGTIERYPSGLARIVAMRLKKSGSFYSASGGLSREGQRDATFLVVMFRLSSYHLLAGETAAFINVGICLS